MVAQSISVVIPAYNEAARLEEAVGAVTTFLAQRGADWELILVDDGSTDETRLIAERLARRDSQHIRVLADDHNRGKGWTVRRGVLAARKALILFMDADQATPIEALPSLERALKQADVAIASRYRPGARFQQRQSFARRVLSRAGNWLIRTTLNLPYTDTQCGFKLFTRSAASAIFPRLTIERWGFDIELLVVARVHQLRVAEVPVSWHDGAQSKLDTGRAAWQTLRELWQIRENERQGRYERDIP